MNIAGRNVLAEVLAQRLIKAPVSLLDPSFPEQNNFILDPAKLKACFCTRRAAKSFTGGLYMVKEAIENPGVNCLFVGLTRLSAEGILLKDILKVINSKHDLGMQFNLSKLTATFPNGSVIYLAGVDTSEDEMTKLLGKKYRLVVIDEASMYSIDQRHLVYGVLKPAVADNSGTICMMGTSSNTIGGLFYDITTGKEPGWSLHRWTAHDNPYMATQWAAEIQEIKDTRPLFMNTNLFKQWYLNQWCIDDDARVYKYQESLNDYIALPYYSYGQWNYVLGVDQGYDDPSAFVVCAFHDNDPNLYIVETFKASKMDITDMANKIKYFQVKYPQIYKVIIDGSAKQAVEEMQKRHGLALTAADKTGKSDFIELMNAEFIQGKIKLSPGSKELQDELRQLVWVLDGSVVKQPRKEDSRCQNHLADAALYAWRYCFQFLSQVKVQPVNLRDKDQWLKHTEKLMDESLDRQITYQQAEEANQAYWEMDSYDQDPLQVALARRRG